MPDKVHFSRAPKTAELEKALRNGATEIFMPRSAEQRMGARAKKLVKERGATIIIESARGRPLSLDLGKMREVVELHRDNRTFREIEDITGIPKSTAHYLIRYAERLKLRAGNRIVYL